MVSDGASHGAGGAPAPGADREQGVDPRVARWLAQARDERIRGAIEAVYRDVDAMVEHERPRCLASGHCCHFGRFGHDLFVTAIETAWFVDMMAAEAPPPATLLELAPSATAPPADRSCPWLDGRLCGARAARPLGCRTFFCDPRARSWSEPLHERLHGRLRELHERFDIVYHYDEWLRMLALFGAGRRRGADAACRPGRRGHS